MYALQKVVTKVVPRVATNPELIPVALVLGAVALICEASK